MDAPEKIKSKKIGSIAVIAALFSATFLLTNSASASPSSAPGSFVAVSPSRIINTRTSTKVGNGLGGGSPLAFTVSGKGGVPNSGATAVSLNVTVTGTEAPDYGGYVTVYPCGTRPDASSLNFVNGQTIANAVTTPVGDGGQICFYVFGRTHLLVDVNGYYASAAAGPQGPTGPQGATGPQGPAGSGGGSDYYLMDTGNLYISAYGYYSTVLYCPTGTVAISANNTVYGLITAVILYNSSALVFLTNDLGFSTSNARGQLTCATTSYTGQTMGSKGSSPNSVESIALSDETAAAEDLAKLTSQAIQAGLNASDQTSKR